MRKLTSWLQVPESITPMLLLCELIEKSLAVEIISYVSKQSDSNNLSDIQPKFSGWLLSTFLYSTNVFLLDSDITEVSGHNSAIVSGTICMKDWYLRDLSVFSFKFCKRKSVVEHCSSWHLLGEQHLLRFTEILPVWVWALESLQIIPAAEPLSIFSYSSLVQLFGVL